MWKFIKSQFGSFNDKNAKKKTQQQIVYISI